MRLRRWLVVRPAPLPPTILAPTVVDGRTGAQGIDRLIVLDTEEESRRLDGRPPSPPSRR